ncbi:MAG: CinA family nicotinamide mononucleotide deamidase-related protein [Myxococcota bacterium]|nr:CinA family nicotinamide mononucleotide deamidase-related protein [Myxococcota bacterium]
MPQNNSPTVVLLALGDELIDGRLADSNGAWLAGSLRRLGCTVVGIRIAGDAPAAIAACLSRALADAQIVIATGGLGPTTDDCTAEAVALLLEEDLALNPTALSWVEARYKLLGRTMAEANRKQAWLPPSAVAVENPQGTAPAFFIEHQDATAWFLPGVPTEMKALWAEEIQPWLENRFDLSPRKERELRCIGIAESTVQDRLESVDFPPEVRIHYRASAPQIRVLLDAPSDFPSEELNQLSDKVHSAIGDSCLGMDTGPIEELVGHLLVQRGETVATAESCTGGGIAHLLTSIPGASRYLLEGSCLYANEAKARIGVPNALIEEHGAVSKPVAIEMAQRIREQAQSSWGISTSGIAGPDGGTPEKPVGTVHMALAWDGGHNHRALALHGSRERIIHLTTHLALDMLRRQISLPSSPPVPTRTFSDPPPR